MHQLSVVHAGKVRIAEELLLKWLDLYPDGKIREVKLDDWGTVGLVIEHPDMPTVKAGDTIPTVSPSYITTSDALGHTVTIRQQGGIT
jgi:hypothetical protein